MGTTEGKKCFKGGKVTHRIIRPGPFENKTGKGHNTQNPGWEGNFSGGPKRERGGAQQGLLSEA